MKKLIDSPISWFLIFLLFYGALAGRGLFRPSKFPHYVYQANSYLKGRLDLIEVPPLPVDLTFRDDKVYMPQPQFPAFLMMPIVAIFGYGTSDVAISVIIGALNAALFFVLLTRAALFWGKAMSIRFKSLMVLLFGLGTAESYCAPLGWIWHIEHVIGLALFLLALIELFGKRRAAIMGICMALGGLTRTNLFFSAPFFLVFIYSLSNDDKKESDEELGFIAGLPWKQWVLFCLPLAAAVGVVLAINYAKFGSILDFGYKDLLASKVLWEKKQLYGSWSLHYFPRDFYCAFLRPPDVIKGFPWLWPNPWGMSIFLATPAFLYIFRASLRDKNVLMLWFGVLCIVGPLMFYSSTGYRQYGWRYSVDILGLLMLLTANGMKWKTGKVAIALIAISILMGFIGEIYSLPGWSEFRLSIGDTE